VTLSPLDGASPNVLGVRAELPPHAPTPSAPFGEGPEIALLKLDAEDAAAHTLVLAVQPVFSRPAARTGEARRFPLEHGPSVAILEWGTGAETTSAEIDIGKGILCTVAASTVVLRGRNDGGVMLAPALINEFGESVAARKIDPNPAPQLVVASIQGVGTRAAALPTTRTFFRAHLPPGETVTFPVPPFAAAMRVMAAPAGASLLLLVLDGTTSANALTAIPLPPVPASVPLPPLADSVRLENTGAAVIQFLQLQFLLAL